MSINEMVVDFIAGKGVDILAFMDISALPNEIRRSYSNAILMEISLSKNYLRNYILYYNIGFEMHS